MDYTEFPLLTDGPKSLQLSPISGSGFGMVNSELNRVTFGGVGDARVSCDDQLKPCETDSSAVRKLKALNRELHQLLAVKSESPTPPVVLAKPNSPVGVSSSSWKDLVVGTTGAPGRLNLEFFPPVILNNKVVVSPSVKVEELGIPKWKNCLVGHFLDKKLSFPVVRSIAMKIWKKFGLCDVSANGNGFYFFNFPMMVIWVKFWMLVLGLLVVKCWF